MRFQLLARSSIRKLLLLALPVFAALAVWSLWFEPGRLVVVEQSLHLPGWRPQLSGLRIAVLSDLHVGSPHNGVERLAEIVASTNATRADLVVILGDFLISGIPGGRYVEPGVIAEHLAALHGPLGVYAVLGNHDWSEDGPGVAAALTNVGIRVLEDDAVRIPYGDSGFWLGGVSDYVEGKHDVRAALSLVKGGLPVILITHNPDIFPDVPAMVSLLLAGHTHGGQVRVPLLGTPIIPSRYGQRYARGHVVEDGRHLFVTSGVGTSILPIRFGVPPEVAVVTLEPERDGSERDPAAALAVAAP